MLGISFSKELYTSSGVISTPSLYSPLEYIILKGKTFILYLFLYAKVSYPDAYIKYSLHPN